MTVMDTLRGLFSRRSATPGGVLVGVGSAVGADAKRSRAHEVPHQRIQQLHAEVLPACTACGAVSFDREVEGRKTRDSELCACGAMRPPVRHLGKIWEKRT